MSKKKLKREIKALTSALRRSVAADDPPPMRDIGMYSSWHVIEKRGSDGRECVDLCAAGAALVPWDSATRFSEKSSAHRVLSHLERMGLGSRRDMSVIECSWHDDPR